MKVKISFSIIFILISFNAQSGIFDGFLNSKDRKQFEQLNVILNNDLSGKTFELNEQNGKGIDSKKTSVNFYEVIIGRNANLENKYKTFLNNKSNIRVNRQIYDEILGEINGYEKVKNSITTKLPMKIFLNNYHNYGLKNNDSTIRRYIKFANESSKISQFVMLLDESIKKWKQYSDEVYKFSLDYETKDFFNKNKSIMDCRKTHNGLGYFLMEDPYTHAHRTNIREDCIFNLGDVEVMQIVKGGVLGKSVWSPLSKIVFIKTNDKYVDGERINGAGYYYSNYSYKTPLGVNKTVRAYKQIDTDKYYFAFKD